MIKLAIKTIFVWLYFSPIVLFYYSKILTPDQTYIRFIDVEVLMIKTFANSKG